MKRKIFLLLAMILSLSLLLTACATKNSDVVTVISEDKAKEAGLALINLAFDVNVTDAEAEYQENSDVIHEGGSKERYIFEEPGRVYLVKVAPEKGGDAYYYASVDAVTGAAYRAEKYFYGATLTAEQQKQADALGPLEEFHPHSLLTAQQEATGIVDKLMKDRLEPDVPTFRVFPDMIETDSVDFPRVQLEYFVLMENGTFYNLTLCWPTMELTRVYRYPQDA